MAFPQITGNNPYEVELLTTQYTTNLQLLLQQMVSRLRSRVMTGNHVGKMASPVQYIGPLEFKAPTGRFSPMNIQEPLYTRRWVFPTDRTLPVLVDSFDELRTIIDPRSGINAAVVAAANRLFDDIIISALFATAYTGVDSSSLTAETFDTSATGFQVPATFGGGGSNTGLIYQKIVEARRILRHYENDLDSMGLTLVIGSQQESDLMNQIEVVSTEFNDRPVLENGKLTRFLGCDIVFSERLQYNSSTNIRHCALFPTDGMYLGLWKDIDTIISQRNDLEGHPWQAYSMVTTGATRLQPGKVIQIECFDTTGADVTV